MSSHPHKKRKSRAPLVLAGVLFLGGCLLFPKKMEYRSTLTSAISGAEFQSSEGIYRLREDGTISYQEEGLRIDVRSLSDEDLNRRFPEDSSQGKYSTNPYTYGDWIDPDQGYIPKRFTVFEVSVYNYTHAKVELDPIAVVLRTDRQETLHSYGISLLSSPHGKSLERYYRSRRGQSGNEYYRFDFRMGVLRSTYYGQDELIFKGENYNGFIVFDPLHPDVKKVRFLIRDFVHKFDGFGRPLATKDLPFDFLQNVAVTEVVETVAEEKGSSTRLVAKGPREMTGNLPGDVARSSSTINAMVKSKQAALNRCFSTAFDAGEAIPGTVVLEFTIAPSGGVTRAEVAESNVQNDSVGECLVEQLKGWRFRPAGEGLASAAAQQPPVQAGRVDAGEDGIGGGANSFGGGADQETVLAQQLAATQDVVVVYPFTFKSAAK